MMIGTMLRDSITNIAEREGQTLPKKMATDLDMRAGGATDQERYVARDQCGWASINGQSGEMTSKGFVSHE